MYNSNKRLLLIKEPLIVLTAMLICAIYFRSHFNNFLVIVYNITFGVLPIVLYQRNGLPLKRLGFRREKLLRQVLWGLVYSIALMIIMIFILFLAGAIFEFNHLSTKIVIFEVFNNLFLIGFSEELLWRGYFLDRICDITDSTILAITVSSLLFGGMHYIVNGSVLQVVFTTVLGFIYAISYKTIKDFSIISLAIAHGLYSLFTRFINARIFI